MVMISHGFSTGALFLLVGMIYERRHTRLIEDYGGIARVMPLFSLDPHGGALRPSGCPGSTASWASSWCCSAASAPTRWRP